ncbi:pentapeptide repeat-containing protein [Actinomadura sp. WMMA1423]|uniref:pentapeptide repeat-containing protein n=1 Tax=Actinomadura sp. WMMA1423 TaxID=2591108 RepID=UPI00114656D7|nr:pentapeptide repeat-containing protein [Actinomadura sp. WMMA1423]
MLTAAGAAALAIWLTTAWLLDVADDAPPGTDRAKIRVDAVRTGLAAGGGAAASVGLMLAFRRQRHQELATALNDQDAIERRITELYNAAAEQLGSDKAPVRLTALYTLERLANDNSRHQQTIVNIICAYLRMPYSPPRPSDPAEEHRERARRNAARYRAARDGRAAPAEPGTHGPDPREEHEVRLTAQRILTTHLRSDAGQHWADISLDLTGATLSGFALVDCGLASATFTRAAFTGNAAWFNSTTFSGETDFSEATFDGFAVFRTATFAGRVWFTEAVFTKDAEFGEATFAEEAMFDDTTFTGTAVFRAATLRSAGFIRTVFTERAIFSSAIFVWDAWFTSATFIGEALFAGATFSEARFDEAVFTDIVDFGGASTSRVDFEAAMVTDAGLAHQIPDGWRVEPAEGDGGRFVRTTTPPPSSDS